jgi:hypothetical protein
MHITHHKVFGWLTEDKHEDQKLLGLTKHIQVFASEHVHENRSDFHCYKNDLLERPDFFRGGLKFYLLLQIECDYYSIRPAPKKAFLGAGHPLTRS